MKNDDSTKFTGDDVAELARDFGKPLPPGMKSRIMKAIHARSLELSKAQEKRKSGK